MQKKTSSTFNSDLIQNAINKPTEKKEKKANLSHLGLLNQYANIHERVVPHKAFKVTFKSLPDLSYISFKGDKNKATYEACKYFKDNFHPSFLCEEMLYEGRARRIPEFDQYAKDGIIPIADYLKISKAKVPCYACGQHSFSYEDYDIGRCFITEEFNLNPYTKGIVLCYDCFQKYMGNR